MQTLKIIGLVIIALQSISAYWHATKIIYTIKLKIRAKRYYVVNWNTGYVYGPYKNYQDAAKDAQDSGYSKVCWYNYKQLIDKCGGDIPEIKHPSLLKNN